MAKNKEVTTKPKTCDTAIRKRIDINVARIIKMTRMIVRFETVSSTLDGLLIGIIIKRYAFFSKYRLVAFKE